MKNLNPLFILFLILSAIVVGIVYLLPYLQNNRSSNPEDRKSGTNMVLKNYGASIDSSAEVFNLSSSYLKALCMLECGGRKDINHRFEPHIYNRLKKVKFGELNAYEHVTREMLLDANDEALKNLASSWGPFQLMGFKCLLLGIKVRDIRGDQAVYYGVKWIDITYGDLIRDKKFRSAFHVHNTGQEFPANGRARTFNPNYCEKGLSYMRYFDSHH